MEDIEKEITELPAVEPLEESIETIKNISIEHAYSEEIVSNDKQENSVDAADTPAVEYQAEKSSLQSIEPPIVEAKQELLIEQVAEKVKSRELKSLLDAAKESNLDTNIVHKRESSGKRTMRSQNPDFVVKHQKFLHKVTKYEKSPDSMVQDNNMPSPKKENESPVPIKSVKRKKDALVDNDEVDGAIVDEQKKSRKFFKNDVFDTIKDGKDSFCWRCHRDGVMVHCETCPRAYHTRCLKQPINNPERWPCPECLAILQAESTKTRSPAMRDMSLEHLCELLKYAVKRMIGCAGSEPFIHPVDLRIFPDYRNYVVQPMDLTTLENNIRNNVYGSTVAFMADAKWILHNSIIYNSYQSKLTTAAKSITKICKQEMSEIETCSECYQNANTKKNSWFVEVCPKPHILLWAKLKGFPYWPGKAMTTNSAGLVDVRFFGAHDRAWIPVKECFLYSKKDPNTTNKNKRNNIAECIKEVNIHIQKLKEKYGDFCHAPYRTAYDPTKESYQLRFMLPKYKFEQKKKAKLPISVLKNPNVNEEKVNAKVFKSNSLDSFESLDDSLEKKSDSTELLVRCSQTSDDTDLLSSTSSTNDNGLNDDKNIQFSEDMEGYGTEDDETTALTLNDEVRKKMQIQCPSDSDEEHKKQNNTSVEESLLATTTTTTTTTTTKTSTSTINMIQTLMLTPENYSKIRIVKSKNKRSIDSMNRKRNLSNTHIESETPHSNKMQRRNSDMSTTSDSSRISGLSDKISRVEEFSDTLEVSLANTSTDSAVVSFSENTPPEQPPDVINLKPVIQVCTGDLFNKNKDLKISPQSKSVRIADRLMKKITGTEIDKVENVKKQILENLETNSSPQEPQLLNDLVSSTNDKESDDKNQSVSSSTETLNTTDSELNHKKEDGEKNKNENNSDESDGGESGAGEEDSESDQSTIGEKNADNSHVKLVNVSDILSGKINGNAALLLTDKDIKNEPLSENDDDEMENVKQKTIKRNNKSSVESESDDDDNDNDNDDLLIKDKEKGPFKIIDNLTRVIDSVATDYNSPLSLSKKELSLRPISKLIHSSKQRARKSFPNNAYNMKMNHPYHHIIAKKIMPEKTTKPIQPIQSANMKVVSSLQNIQPHHIVTTSNNASTITNHNININTNISSNNNQEPPNMLYLSPKQTPVINNMALLPPNQPITLTQNVGNPILAMVQHHGISTPSLIIQQNSAPISQAPIVASNTSTSSVCTTTPITTHILPSTSESSIVDDRSGITEQISKAVGDLFCRPPPVLKPRPPGPLSTFFDEGLLSTAGPTTKLVNSISHRLSDYFRGLLCESFKDLSTIGSPEAKIRSLELEIERLKYKHNEEMVELRKNISSILKDIQKSIIEDKAKIVDETRSACEAERLRCIEETKSKQWCAFCLKEAQFYCCWNTSYCDYPCQQKHWPAHMNTCSQARNAATGAANPNDKSKLTKAVNTTNKTMIKPARMIVKQTSKGVPMYVPVQRTLQAGQQTLTLVESTPGNFEIVGNHGPISLGGKIVPTTTIKVKPGNVFTVASSSSNNTSLATAGTSKTIILSQKPPQIIHKTSTENKT